MSTETNKAKVRAFWEEAMSKGNMAAVDALVDPDEIVHSYPDDPASGHGPAVIKGSVTAFRASWADLHATVGLQIAEGEWVMTQWTLHGTYQGGDPTLPETAIGKSMMITGISINRFDHNMSVEAWTEMDRLGMLQQLGILPAPKQAEERGH
jgi:hypothetical protein